MVVEEFNIGRTQIIIHDDCIVSNEKAEEILKRLGNTFHNYNLRKRERGDWIGLIELTKRKK